MYIYTNKQSNVTGKNMGRPKLPITFNTCVTCSELFNPGKHKEKLNCSPKCLKIYNEIHKAERMKKTFDSIKKNHGVDSYPKAKGFYDKVKKTKKEKYGDEHYNNLDKIQTTLEKNYGVKYPGLIENAQELSKKTKKEKYNNEYYNNRELAKTTIVQKYGTEHHLQTKECIDKMKKTNLEKHGIEYTIQTIDAKNKRIEHNKIKYGSNYYFESKNHKQNILSEKLKKIEKILFENNLSFDLDSYCKLREKEAATNQLHYIKYPLSCNTCSNKFLSSWEVTPVCRKCFPLTSVSIQQKELNEFLQSLKISFEENTRKIINPLELDFYIPSSNLAIELNGNYYHSELGGNKSKNYHYQKSSMCNLKGIKLIHIFEDEWINHKDIIKSRLKNLLGMTTNKIYARKCKIKIINANEKKEFLNQNHMQGNDYSNYNIGMFYNNELISVMTFSKKRLALGFKNNIDDNMIELSRFCSKLDCNIIGGFKKMISFLISNKPDCKKIITYADCRWSGINPDNTVYKKSNFEFIHITKPNYFYMFKKDYFTRYHRFTYNKHIMIKKFNADNNLTEWQIAQNNKMDRIWDCGSMKFILTIK